MFLCTEKLLCQKKNFRNQTKASGIQLMFCYNKTRFRCIE